MSKGSQLKSRLRGGGYRACDYSRGGNEAMCNSNSLACNNVDEGGTEEKDFICSRGAEKANKSWETREKRIEDLFLLLSLFRFFEAVGPSFSLS